MDIAFGPAVAAIAAIILVGGPLAVGVTKVVDLVRGLVDREDRAPGWVWNTVPILLGIAVCLGWGINLLEAVVSAVPALSDKAGSMQTLGQVLTGIIVGGMAGFWHDKLQTWTTWASEQETVVVEPDPLDVPLDEAARRRSRDV